MSVYSVLLFLHIVGALGLFAAIALEQAALINFRRASTVAQLREWARLLGANRRVDGPAGLTLLATGIYMAIAHWGHNAWIWLGLLGVVLMVVVGAVMSRRQLEAIVKGIPVLDGPIPAALRQQLHDPRLHASWVIRVAIGIGIVFDMSVKPGTVGALFVMGIAVAAGVVVAMASWGEGRRGSAAGERAAQG